MASLLGELPVRATETPAASQAASLQNQVGFMQICPVAP